MQRPNVIHLFLAIFLTLAVTDYLWVELIDKDQAVAELEIEKEKELEEELRESDLKEGKLKLLSFLILNASNQDNLTNLIAGHLKHGNSFELADRDLNPPLFIKHCQLKLHCA